MYTFLNKTTHTASSADRHKGLKGIRMWLTRIKDTHGKTGCSFGNTLDIDDTLGIMLKYQDDIEQVRGEPVRAMLERSRNRGPRRGRRGGGGGGS